MKKTFMLCLFLGTCFMVRAQMVLILDIETKDAIGEVAVTGNTPQMHDFANTNGQIDLSKYKNSDKITFAASGYKTVTLSYAEIIASNRIVWLSLVGEALNEVVISANRYKEKQAEVAQKVQVIRRSEIQNMNQTSMADVIANSGNIMVQKSQLGGGSPIIRGFEANKVLMVVDGVRMNNAIYRGGHLQNVVTLDNAIMDRVELVFGPGSVVYGSDALGGVMHFFTKNPTLSSTDKTLVKTNAYTRYFSAASGYAAHADVSVGSKRFGSLTSVTYSNYGDLRQGAVRNPFYYDFGNRPWSAQRINGRDSMVANADTNIQLGSAYSQYDILQKFLFKQNNDITHVLNLQYSNSTDVPRYDRLTQMSKGLPKFADWYYGPQKRLFASYSVRNTKRTMLYDHVQTVIAYQNIEESRNSRKFNSNNLNSQVEEVGVLSLNTDFYKHAGEHELRYGLEFYLNDVNSTAIDKNIVTNLSMKGITRYPDGGSTMSSIAVYGSHSWEISEKLILNDGIRYSHVGLTANFNDKSFFPFPYNTVNQSNGAINGNIGLVATPNYNWRFTLNLSSGFRAPNVDDLSKVFESVAGSVIVPNPNLKPEYTYNAEMGVNRNFNKRLNVSVIGYYTYYINALSVQPAKYLGADSIPYLGQMSRVTSTVNASKSFIYGFEGQMAGNINEFLSVYGSVNYTYGRIITDSVNYALDHIPPVFGKLGFRINKNKWHTEFFTMYSGWKQLDNYNILGEDNIEYATKFGMPSWFTLNVRLNYTINKNFNVQAACENILDHNYRVFASNISASGRNFIVTLRYSY